MQRTPDELAFLARYDPTAFDRPSVAVDVVVLTLRGTTLHVLLVQRAEHPDRGRHALPGAFVGPREELEAAAVRALAGKAGISGVYLEQLATFGAPDRDPRLRVISVAWLALAPSLPDGAPVWPVEELPALAFDHAEIIATAHARMRGKVEYTDLGLRLLPDRFTLRDAQRAWEAVLGRPVNKDSFRRSLLHSGLVRPLGEREADSQHRPAELYTRRT